MSKMAGEGAQSQMTVLDVFLNDGKLCRAGVGGEGVLTAMVSWAKLSTQAAATARRFDRAVEETRLQVGGLGDDIHRTWSERDLAVGDRVSIVVGRANSCDPPARETRRDAQQAERLERDYYLRLKRQFERAGSQPSTHAAGGCTTTNFL